MKTILNELVTTSLNGNRLAENHSDYEAKGYLKAQNASGHFIAIENNLHALYEEYKENVKRDSQRQNMIKLPFRNKVDKLKRKNIELENIIKKGKSERIPFIQEQIEQLKEKIAEIKRNPQAHLGEKLEKTSYYIGSTILIFLTLYLFIFYSSASFSGFFREFEPGVNLREAMLDPNTFIKAYHHGVGELSFILLMPFIFLALGYLIHKFIDKKSIVNYLKVSLLLTVTFIFDGFLAYKISEGIYSVNIGLFAEEYTISKALTEVDFWVVIFAGFVAYIVWGLVFDFVIKACRNLDRIGMLIKLKNEKIHEKEDTIFKAQNNIDAYRKQVNDNNIQIANNENLIVNPIIVMDEIKRIHFQFMSGWKNLMIERDMPLKSIMESDKIANYCLETFKYKLTKIN
jgi:hypothetical protein